MKLERKYCKYNKVFLVGEDLDSGSFAVVEAQGSKIDNKYYLVIIGCCIEEIEASKIYHSPLQAQERLRELESLNERK